MNWNPSDVFKTEVDDLVEFKYDGGSHPGEVRVVRVKSVDNGHISGEDVYSDDEDNFRRFNMNKVYDFRFLRKKPISKNKIEFDPNRGMVLTSKKGDSLTVMVNNRMVGVTLHKAGTASDKDVTVTAQFPSENNVVFDKLCDLFSKFSQ